MKTPQVAPLPGMTPLGIAPRETQTVFHAVNFDERARSNAYWAAEKLTFETGKAHKVIYRDDYNDYSVQGDYIVVAA